MQILLLNGPPGVGKDYLADMLSAGTDRVAHVKFADHLKEMAASLFDQDYSLFTDRRLKDKPVPELHGKTPRQVLIQLSENFCKPLWGKSYFGEELARHIEYGLAGCFDICAVSDSGFREEAEVLVETFGADNCRLVRLHAPDRSFDNDSRSYIDLDDLGVRSWDIRHTFDGEEKLLQYIQPVLKSLKERAA